MNKSQRIYLNTGDTGNQNQDKYIKVKLEQDIDTLEFMSLKIGTADAYQNFNADYGVLVGRVIANKGIGVPNAKVSIFIPIDDEDSLDADIYSIYPYDTPRTKNNEGKRYNLLPRVGIKNPNTGVVSPKQPFGSFPTKEEVLSNDPILKVYKKYYKYTTLTNGAGDYMIFGVPIGTQTVHLSVDITDIGKYSMTPLTMVNSLGYSENLFSQDKTKIKPSDDLDDLINIETQEIAVDIIPFWGDTENFEIGITRQDFKIKAQLINTFTIFGSVFTEGEGDMWSADFRKSGDAPANYAYRFYRARDNANNTISIATKRTTTVQEKVYYYPNDISDNEIDADIYAPEKMKLLDPSEYTVFKENGDFVFIINANRNKVITGADGTEVGVADSFDGGVYTEFRGFVTFEISKDHLGFGFTREKIGQNASGSDDYYAYPFRYKYKFPQKSGEGKSFTDEEDTNTLNWRKEDYTFKAGKIYSVAKFQGITYNNGYGSDFDKNSNGFAKGDDINDLNKDPYWNVGVIGVDNGFNGDNSAYEFPSNGSTNNGAKAFGANWLNFSIHFNVSGKLTENWGSFQDMRSNSHYSAEFKKNHFYNTNEQLIAGDVVDTRYFARSDLHHTDFIEVEKSTILKIADVGIKGFSTKDAIDPDLKTEINNGDFRNGETPTNTYKGGRLNGDNEKSTSDPYYYFYKGHGDSDCIAYLISLGLV